MARVCSIGVPKAILSNVIGKSEAEKLSKADIINVMTDLMSYTGLTQEALLDKKYKPLILNEIKKLNERRPDNKAQEFTSKEKESIVNNAAYRDVLQHFCRHFFL